MQFPNIQFKREPALLAFAAVVVIAGFVALGFHLLTWKELGGFLLAAFAMPGLFGRASSSPTSDSSPPGPLTGGHVNDVWETKDGGVTWTKVEPSPPAPPGLPRITYDEDDETSPSTERTPR